MLIKPNFLYMSLNYLWILGSRAINLHDKKYFNIIGITSNMNWKFWQKCLKGRKESLYDNCSQCGKKINTSNILALQKGKGVDEEYDPIIDDEKLFCSEECLQKYQKTNKMEEYDLVKLSRCPVYYDCKEIDNLRQMCEKTKIINEDSKERDAGQLFYTLPEEPFCDPANAGIIKASLKLKKQSENAMRNSNIQFALTVSLTLVIIGLTVLNIWFV